MRVTLGGIFNVPNDVQLLNADDPINDKLPPSATAGILLQTLNTVDPIDWILPAIVSVLVMPVQPINALLLMMVTLSGIFNVPNVVQPLNADAPINNKFPPSATAGMREQFPNAEIPIVRIFPVIVRVLDIFTQFSNALVPMLLTLRGMLIVPNDVLLRNAKFPMTSTFPPIVKFVILVQPEKALSPIL
jgi:hypothetical protein